MEGGRGEGGGGQHRHGLPPGFVLLRKCHNEAQKVPDVGVAAVLVEKRIHDKKIDVQRETL
jgi:hypothetical protein